MLARDLRRGLSLDGGEQPVLEGAGIEHGLRRREGLAHHDHQGFFGIEACFDTKVTQNVREGREGEAGGEGWG